MPGRIVKLPEAVANQIAAGEVVERPVAVVKELVENALDAEARAIEIQFEQGGKTLIRVLDDGGGMTPGDALMALERHATSKIRTTEDILRIGSFGFRGEALPSIASVSRFCLRTRTREAAEGTEVRVNGGGAPEVRQCGMPPGTEVSVEQLFISVPARRKFMKTDRTEAAHILQMGRLLAVAHPEVAFCLIEDGHEVFRSPACPDRRQRVREIFGRRRAEELLEADFTRSGIRVHGLVGRPGTGRNTRAELVTYVNRRPVDSRLLSYAVIESYHRFLPRGLYPVAFLFVEVPPGAVDVNVHPAKREVRFRNDPEVRAAVMEGLIELLTRASRQALAGAERVAPVPLPASPSQPPPVAAATGATVPSPRPAPLPSPAARPAWRPEPELPPAAAAVPPGPRPAPGWRHCGVLRQQVGLFESADGLILLNARAARERVVFERIEAALRALAPARQPLLIPALLELSPLEASLLADQLAFFDSMGFEIEPFGRHLFRIRSVPAWLENAQPEAFVEELLGRIRERGLRPSEPSPARALVARMAAAREARGPAPANPEEWEALARALLACDNPLLDARGRPAFIEIRHAEVARRLMLETAAGELEGLEGGG